MSNLTSQFLQAAAKPVSDKIIVWTWCDKCLIRKDFVLVQETKLTEIYACPDCGTRKEYTVK